MSRVAKRLRRKNLDAPESIEDVLGRAGEDRFASKRAKQQAIPRKEWRAAVGPRIADRAQPISIERGVLTIKVATSVWANELHMLAPELLARLKLCGFAVISLRFRVGILDTVGRPPERRATRKIPPPALLEPELRALVANVADTELRVTIEKAACANLAWQRHIKVQR
ncbi:MAG: DUF721 domain-containing protein [Polyangiaceae bacterium]|nr:DUF721 domain-containing protein [Polyangiaceae bacterium]